MLDIVLFTRQKSDIPSTNREHEKAHFKWKDQKSNKKRNLISYNRNLLLLAQRL